MIDKAQIDAGKAAMKAVLVERRISGHIQFLGQYDPASRPQWSDGADQSEMDGQIDIEALAQAFMRGAGIEPMSDVAALQAEVAQLRAEFEGLRSNVAIMRLVPRPGNMAEDVITQREDTRRRTGFRPLTPRTPED